MDPCRGQADGIRGNSWPKPVPCGRECTFPGLGEGAAPHSPVTFQVGHFSEPRCLLMSWGERLSVLYPSSGPHITSAPRGWPRASRLWLQARALCQPGLSGQLAHCCQPGACPGAWRLCLSRWGPTTPSPGAVASLLQPEGGSQEGWWQGWALELTGLVQVWTLSITSGVILGR